MRYVFLFILFAMLLLPGASALEISEYNITFDVFPDGEVNEGISIVFRQAVDAGNLNYVALGEISDFRISADGNAIDFTLEKSGNENNVKFFIPQGTRVLEIGFTANDIVFMKDSTYSFFAALEPPKSDRVNILAYLPKGFAVYRDVVFPAGYEMLTDGERIYIKWSSGSSGEIPVSFKFYNTHEDINPAIIVAVAIIAIITIAYLLMHYRKKVRKEFLRGFSEDERKVLNELAERKICMQKVLEKQFGFSRAKMTRIVKTLEKKELVEKERIGRKNRLFYRK